MQSIFVALAYPAVLEQLLAAQAIMPVLSMKSSPPSTTVSGSRSVALMTFPASPGVLTLQNPFVPPLLGSVESSSGLLGSGSPGFSPSSPGFVPEGFSWSAHAATRMATTGRTLMKLRRFM